MKILTSYYGAYKKIVADGVLPIRISTSHPRWLPKMDSINGLFPEWDLVKEEDFEKYKGIMGMFSLSIYSHMSSSVQWSKG